ncbi:hypothetical protein L873DRAFT_1798518 [Choiromyces venosus 120613-1]|uniref:Uncharacterized protein n=1 Tax=Choiromyces venosus 120613-1 TaxID=1336337 RepID=A0A3N4K339_9PEZI|nr:hypothetical protein L873DRAFT_1798518 [Choiromyces venosus 120613-1]
MDGWPGPHNMLLVHIIPTGIVGMVGIMMRSTVTNAFAPFHFSVRMILYRRVGNGRRMVEEGLVEGYAKHILYSSTRVQYRAFKLRCCAGAVS